MNLHPKKISWNECIASKLSNIVICEMQLSNDIRLICQFYVGSIVIQPLIGLFLYNFDYEKGEFTTLSHFAWVPIMKVKVGERTVCISLPKFANRRIWFTKRKMYLSNPLPFSHVIFKQGKMNPSLSLPSLPLQILLSGHIVR